MPVTERQIEIGMSIEEKVHEIVKKYDDQARIDEALEAMMPEHMEDFNEALESGVVDDLCDKLPGFHLFANMIERVEARGEGVYDDLLGK